MTETKRKITELLSGWSDGPKVLVAHTDCPEEITEMAMFVGSTEEIIEWSKVFNGQSATLYVAGPLKLVYGVRQILPNSNVWHFDYENI